jgi:hypothetical protein
LNINKDDNKLPKRYHLPTGFTVGLIIDFWQLLTKSLSAQRIVSHPWFIRQIRIDLAYSEPVLYVCLLDGEQDYLGPLILAF